MIGNDNDKLSDSLISNAIYKLTCIASNKQKNCIIDQSNCYSSLRKKRIELFKDFKTIKAIVILPHLFEYEKRINARKLLDHNKIVTSSSILQYKKTYSLPKLEEGFTEIDYLDITLQEAERIIEDYRYDAKKCEELDSLKYKNRQLEKKLEKLKKSDLNQIKSRSIEKRNSSPRSFSKNSRQRSRSIDRSKQRFEQKRSNQLQNRTNIRKRSRSPYISQPSHDNYRLLNNSRL